MYLPPPPSPRTGMDLIKSKIGGVKDQMLEGLSVFAPSNLKKKIKEIKQMSSTELAVGFCRLLFLIMYHSAFGVVYVLRKVWQALMGLMQGPPAEKVGFPVPGFWFVGRGFVCMCVLSEAGAVISTFFCI